MLLVESIEMLLFGHTGLEKAKVWNIDLWWYCIRSLGLWLIHWS